MDLSDQFHQVQVLDMLETMKPLAVHLGLPSGTCSRAREKPLPPRLQSEFSAPPLRDAQNLFGYGGLEGTNLLKVNSANKLYRFAVRILFACYTMNIMISIENPVGPWLWAILTALVLETNDASFTSWFGNLAKVDFSMCMHGSTRNKKTRFLATPTLYDDLAVECDNKHSHQRWNFQTSGQSLLFHSASESEYPPLLCKRMAQALVLQAQLAEMDMVPIPSAAQTARHAWGTQTSKAQPLIPEFKTFVYSDSPTTCSGHRLLVAPLPGAKITQLPNQGQNGMKSGAGHEADFGQETGSDSQSETSHVKAKRQRTTFKYGVQWDYKEFFEQAKASKHPKDPAAVLPDSLKTALFEVLTTDPVELAKTRLQAVLTIRGMAKDLEVEERKLKSAMEPRVAGVLHAKRILLWESLLRASGYEDLAIVEMVKSGICLDGEHPRPPAQPHDWKPALTTADELCMEAVWRRRVLMADSSEQELEREKDLHTATLKEVKLGHLRGPFSEKQISEELGSPDWLLTPRFILYQGEERKIRAIDDCKRSGVNSSYTTNFKLQLLDVDVLACLLACTAESLASRKVLFSLSSGETLASDIHPAVASDSWQGRTLDLSKAYKQLAIHPTSRRLCVIGYRLDENWQFYLTDVLPFGSVSAVFSFNRVSRSLHHIMATYLHAPLTCFYDDFPTISPSSSASILSKSMSAVLDLLGWEHAKVGSKAVDFASEFNALGICIQLQPLNSGSFVLKNKNGRVEKICSMLEAVAGAGHITRSQAAEIQGHINFATGFYTCRALRFLVSAFERLSHVPSKYGAKDLRALCSLAMTMLKSLPPRKYTASEMKEPLLLFTDGAWEDGVATAGAVFFDPLSNQGFVCEVEVPDTLVNLWKQDVGDQLICQIEMWAFVSTRWFLKDILKDRLVVAWIDNEASRFACVKGASNSFSLQAMTRLLAHIEVTHPTGLWYERVCSYSNPSDGPSRGLADSVATALGLSVGETIKADQSLVESIARLHKDQWSVCVLSEHRGHQPEHTNRT